MECKHIHEKKLLGFLPAGRQVTFHLALQPPFLIFQTLKVLYIL